MIFNKKIDNGISLMLSSGTDNSDSIMQFITNMPEGLKKKILEKLNIYEEYKKTGIKNFSFLCGEYDIDNRMLYTFEIDPYTEEIEMGYMECYGGIYKDVFKMTLYLGDNIEDIKNFRKKYIGSVQENISCLYKYYLYKTPISDIVMYSKENNRSVKNHFSLVDLFNMPEELYLDNIMDKSLTVRRKQK